MPQHREQRRKKRFPGVKSLNTWGWEFGKMTEHINVEDTSEQYLVKGVSLRMEAPWNQCCEELGEMGFAEW